MPAATAMTIATAASAVATPVRANACRSHLTVVMGGGGGTAVAGDVCYFRAGEAQCAASAVRMGGGTWAPAGRDHGNKHGRGRTDPRRTKPIPKFSDDNSEYRPLPAARRGDRGDP